MASISSLHPRRNYTTYPASALTISRIYLRYLPTQLDRVLQSPGTPSLLRHHITPRVKYRNINLFPIDYALQPRLRGRLTLLRTTSSRKPWTSGGGDFYPPLVTHVSIRTSDTSSMRLHTPSSAYRTLLYHYNLKVVIRSFGMLFSPVKSSAQDDSTSELLRFL